MDEQVHNQAQPAADQGTDRIFSLTVSALAGDPISRRELNEHRKPDGKIARPFVFSDSKSL